MVRNRVYMCSSLNFWKYILIFFSVVFCGQYTIMWVFSLVLAKPKKYFIVWPWPNEVCSLVLQELPETLISLQSDFHCLSRIMVCPGVAWPLLCLPGFCWCAVELRLWFCKEGSYRQYFHPVVDAGCAGKPWFGMILGVFFLRNNIVCYLEQKTKAVITTWCAPWSKSLRKADSIF